MSSMPPLKAVENPARAASALYLIVFVAGAVLMGVEIAGAKVLAPGFGTATFVWGSIIGVFMGALATGYYIGGNIADKHPFFEWLAGIVAAAALWTLLLPRFGPYVADQIATMDIGKVFGPLSAACALFFVPSVLMGMVSPFSVKLNATSLSGVGGVAGRLYALSTFGSIVGTLLTTFILIPAISLSNVLQLLGLILLACAIASLILFKTATGAVTRRDNTTVGVMALLLLMTGELWAGVPVPPKLSPGERLLYYKDSAYHEISVCESLFYVDPNDPHDRDGGTMIKCKNWEDKSYIHRSLKFNANLESGIYPFRDEYKNYVSYTDLLHLPLLWNPEPERMLVVGGGGGIIPSQYSRWYKTKVDIAELDDRVGYVARNYFQMPAAALEDGDKNLDTPGRIRFYYGDGRQTIRRQLTGPYDVVVLDAYSSGGQIPFHLMTWEFLSEVKSKLKPGGVLITNIISGLRNGTQQDQLHNADLFLAEYKTLNASRHEALNKVEKAEDEQPLFKHLYVFPKVYHGYSLDASTISDYRNVIILATDTPFAENLSAEVERMEKLAAELSVKGEDPEDDDQRGTFPKDAKIKVDLWPHIRDFKAGRAFHLASQEELKNPFPPILTDDYAPVDVMYRPVRRDEEMQRIR